MRREFVLSEAEAMMPLVQPILAEIVVNRSVLRKQKRLLQATWDCRNSERFEIRKNCYKIEDAVKETERRYEELRSELRSLGVTLVDSDSGVAGFPFLWARRVGSRRIRKAVFLFKIGGKSPKIRSWRFAGERREHRVPTYWRKNLTTYSIADDVIG